MSESEAEDDVIRLKWSNEDCLRALLAQKSDIRLVYIKSDPPGNTGDAGTEYSTGGCRYIMQYRRMQVQSAVHEVEGSEYSTGGSRYSVQYRRMQVQSSAQEEAAT